MKPLLPDNLLETVKQLRRGGVTYCRLSLIAYGVSGSFLPGFLFCVRRGGVSKRAFVVHDCCSGSPERKVEDSCNCTRCRFGVYLLLALALSVYAGHGWGGAVANARVPAGGTGRLKAGRDGAAGGDSGFIA